ncbi:hypothetical protein SAMN05443661_11355 [Natronobacterium gregoryi]|uniref:Uncharacterized protein n=2 Tax=Natronobacterium gregoryi TaxID=44930 RepID=L0ALF8_NATGS|nr:hypothetical protein Natgr_2887 [Natronobacterium gregoryi SP2]SFJ07368.1 hypothetical protein SAMN05443661_11355 [Natronobacterium gregoryi]
MDWCVAVSYGLLYSITADRQNGVGDRWKIVTAIRIIEIIVGVHSFPVTNHDTASKDGLRNLRLATIIPIIRFTVSHFRHNRDPGGGCAGKSLQ